MSLDFVPVNAQRINNRVALLKGSHTSFLARSYKAALGKAGYFERVK
jgi:hypothetical protein